MKMLRVAFRGLAFRGLAFGSRAAGFGFFVDVVFGVDISFTIGLRQIIDSALVTFVHRNSSSSAPYGNGAAFSTGLRARAFIEFATFSAFGRFIRFPFWTVSPTVLMMFSRRRLMTRRMLTRHLY